jgi:hypothetical protein
MRVSINTEEKSKGLIFRKPYFSVNVSVIFSEEEKAIILQRKLKDYIVMLRDWDITRMNEGLAARAPEFWASLGKPDLSVRHLMEGVDRYGLPDPVRAKEYEQSLVDALKTLKSFFEGSKTVGEAKTFEL